MQPKDNQKTTKTPTRKQPLKSSILNHQSSILNHQSSEDNIEPNGSKKRKVQTAYGKCLEVYDNFIQQLTGVPAKIDGAQGNAMKAIIKYLERAKKEGIVTGKHFP